MSKHLVKERRVGGRSRVGWGLVVAALLATMSGVADADVVASADLKVSAVPARNPVRNGRAVISIRIKNIGPATTAGTLHFTVTVTAQSYERGILAGASSGEVIPAQCSGTDLPPVHTFVCQSAAPIAAGGVGEFRGLFFGTAGQPLDVTIDVAADGPIDPRPKNNHTTLHTFFPVVGG